MTGPRRYPKSRVERDLAWKAEEQARIIQCFKRVYATEEGREALDYIIHGICHVDSRQIVSADSHQTYVNLGKRDVGLSILQIINAPADETKIEVIT